MNFPSRCWIRRGEKRNHPHTSLDEINDSVVRSERGELVRGSDPPLVYSAHTTAGDEWRAPNRPLQKMHLAAGVCGKQRQNSQSSPNRAKNRILRVFEGRPQDNAGNLSHPSAWINTNSSALSPTLMWPCVRSEESWSWVVSISRSKVHRGYWTTLAEA